jgi:hypothetical protein
MTDERRGVVESQPGRPAGHLRVIEELCTPPTPPGDLVGAILDRVKRDADQRKLRRERRTGTR